MEQISFSTAATKCKWKWARNFYQVWADGHFLFSDFWIHIVDPVHCGFFSLRKAIRFSLFETERAPSDCTTGTGDADDGKWRRADNLIDENRKGLVWKKLASNMWIVLPWERSYLMRKKSMGNTAGHHFPMPMWTRPALKDVCVRWTDIDKHWKKIILLQINWKILWGQDTRLRLPNCAKWSLKNVQWINFKELTTAPTVSVMLGRWI